MARTARGTPQSVGITADGVTPLGTSGAPFYISLTNTKLRVTERIIAPAAGATVHAGVAGGAALNVTTAFTQIQTPTNLRISRSGAGVATVYTVTGTRFGVTQTEVINSNGASDVDGLKVFDTVTSLVSDVDPTVTTTLKTGAQIGLSNVVDAIELAGVSSGAGTNAVAETFTLNAAKDGFTPTTAADGTKQQFVRYRILATTAQP